MVTSIKEQDGRDLALGSAGLRASDLLRPVSAIGGAVDVTAVADAVDAHGTPREQRAP
jgi:hypothetical protein